jgi:hypothetical protein
MIEQFLNNNKTLDCVLIYNKFTLHKCYDEMKAKNHPSSTYLSPLASSILLSVSAK